MSSRLFIEVRERRGLAYMVRSSISSYRDQGTFYVQAGLDPARLAPAVKVIKEELQRMKEELVNNKELEDAQNNIAGNLALQMEDSHNQANWYGEKFLFAPKIETYEEVVKRLRQVTVRQVKNLATKLFDFDELRMAAIGPFSKEKFLKSLF
jgi:predicted Zn-dependent peptidase